ncbi:hypothetical protein DVA67_003635 [Solirubrobacter sp. CPCC 204708]|nr:hypothetical protein [Solirubrobacter deserti]
MRHPSDGTLRRLLDEPIGVADAEADHVIGCSTCSAALAEAQEDAAFAASALAVDVEVDVDAAWERFAHALAVEAPAAPPRARRRRFSLRGQTAAMLGVAALLTGAGVAAAADWLEIFSTRDVAPLAINQADLVGLPDLSAYGDVEVIKEPNVRSVKDARSAAELTGLTVPEVAQLPSGVTGVPAFQASEQATAVFTFSAAKAREAAARAGEPLPPLPAGLDGEPFRLVVGPGVATIWPGNSGLPALMVGRAGAPKVFSTGVPFETARGYLLSLPGLPEDVAAQLRRFGGADGTFPIPIPADQLTTSTTDVGGTRATVFRTRDGALSGVVWVRDERVNLVAGTLSEDEVLTVARGLR